MKKGRKAHGFLTEKEPVRFFLPCPAAGVALLCLANVPGSADKPCIPLALGLRTDKSAKRVKGQGARRISGLPAEICTCRRDIRVSRRSGRAGEASPGSCKGVFTGLKTGQIKPVNDVKTVYP